MEIAKILENKGRIELVELASLLLQSPVEAGEVFGEEEIENDCSTGIQGNHELVRRQLRTVFVPTQVD